jgi:RNA polymerase sigma factor (sigma-70 family)
MTPLLAQRQRPDRAFERIYRRHVGDVYRYALAVMRNQPDAEDVTQTTFLNAYRALQRGEQPEKPQNWLIAIAHNVCRQRFRQSARRPTEVTFDDDIGSQLVESDDTPTGEDIRRALGHLAFNQRAALVMRELEGRSYAEIATVLEVSPSAVETLIFRARRALREQLESALTCGEAELAISRQLDRSLPRNEKGALRAHLRACKECATFARRQRAQRTALRSLAAVPIPSSLTSLFGGGGAAVGSGVALKGAVALTAGVLIGGAGYEGVRNSVAPSSHGRPAGSTRHPSTARPDTVTHGQHANSGLAGAAQRRLPATAHGRITHGHARGPSYHGDASVAARHRGVKKPKPVHVPHRARAHSTRAQLHRPATSPKPAKPSHGSTRHARSLPGPYDGGPPPGKSNGHSK